LVLAVLPAFQLMTLIGFLLAGEYEMILFTMRYIVCFCIAVWGFVLTPGSATNASAQSFFPEFRKLDT
jgi:hypothetical protein